jgi:chaperone LolA
MKHTPRRAALLLFLAASLLPAFAAAGNNGVARLHAFFDGLRSLSADFEQTISQNGRLVQETRGRLHILRPGKFRWAYDSPFEQLLITDGSTLWVYEPDLEQVTRSELDASVGNTPAVLLSTQEPLDRLFLIIDGGEKDGLEWALLEPYGEQAAFSRIFLGFDGSTLAAMEIVDALEQRVQIRFRALQRNDRVDPALFEFVIPDGVDVIGAD